MHWDLGSVAPLLRLAPERRLRVRLTVLLLATSRSLADQEERPELSAMQGTGACACLAVATGVRASSRVQERASLTSAEAAPSPNRGSFARTVCVVREVDAIPLELCRQFLDRVVARFELRRRRACSRTS